MSTTEYAAVVGERYLTSAEVAALTGYTARFVQKCSALERGNPRRLAWTGDKRHRRFTRAAVEDWMQRLSGDQPTLRTATPRKYNPQIVGL